MSKNYRVHFLTAYVEYLLDNGVRSEEYYLGDASRFMRYLLANVTEDDVMQFIEGSANSPSYRNRLEKTLRKFFVFASERLSIDTSSFLNKQKKPDAGPHTQELVSSSISSGRGDTI